jgi:hypothetical protein
MGASSALEKAEFSSDYDAVINIAFQTHLQSLVPSRRKRYTNKFHSTQPLVAPKIVTLKRTVDGGFDQIFVVDSGTPPRV